MKNLFAEQGIPFPVKIAAGVFVFSSLLNVVYFFVYWSINSNAFLALIKVAAGLLFAHGLLKLKSGWRAFSMILGCLAVAVPPIYLLLMLTSPEVMNLLIRQTMIDSEPLIYSGFVLVFLLGLAIVIPLNRPEAKTAFGLQAATTES